MPTSTPLKPFPNALLKKLPEMEDNHLSDELYAIAFNIEMSLLQTDAVPNIDYTRLDLFKMAESILSAMLKNGKGIHYTYPTNKIV